MNNEVVVTREYEGVTSLSFYCDGCKYAHTIQIAGAEKRWDWDGNREKPTIAPSVLCWLEPRADADAEERKYIESHRCHSFVRGGMIEYLSDCGHSLAGKTIPLHPFPEGYGI